jgi:hypothetical protein
MSCLEDFCPTAEVIADTVLHLAGKDCSISQRQARSWIHIVNCMRAADVVHDREDRRALILQVIRCTFMKTPSAAQQGTWTRQVYGGEDHALWRRLWVKVEYALQGKNIGVYKELAWLANVSRKAPPSIVSGTARKRVIAAQATPMESGAKKSRK